MKTSSEVKLYNEMSDDEQLQYSKQLTEFATEKLPILEKLGDAWELSHRNIMDIGLKLLAAFYFARDYVDAALRYGDYSARVYRLRFYIEKAQAEISKSMAAKEKAVQQQQPRRGRPASAETLAKREAEAKAAEQQMTMQPFVAPGSSHNEKEYKLSIAQIRPFLSPELQERSDNVRALRNTFAAASERAKTMADMKANPETIKPWTKQAADAVESYQAIYAAIDEELAVVWYRLQNDEPYRRKWFEKFGFKSYEDVHPDLIHDLKKHYQKMQSAEFDHRMRTLVEQESPEYIAQQKADAAKKKEVQDILRYLKRKDKGQNVETARQKFSRLEELLGKKEAADYRPLLTKIESDHKSKNSKKKK